MSALSVRRPLSVLAVLAMVATLLFAVAGTASAATVKPSNPATFSACPDNAGIPDAGFTDIPTASFFDDSVNCLAYYATTTGTTPTTYSPAEDVTRAQMAVFLYRMAPEAGVVLDSTPPDAGFTDISELSAEAQTAINSLADKGIVKGKTATTYSPADSVWRQQMALFLKRFSDAASAPTAGPGGTQAKNTTGTTTNFTDLGSVTLEANTAIIDVFHLGVAAGTTATTFDPLGNVNRGQMSLFLTRMAAHMNVRPAGINIQADPMTGNDLEPTIDGLTSDVAVTLRTAAFLPISNTLTDTFAFPSTGGVPSSAFLNDGTCNVANVDQLPVGYGPDPCEIDAGDMATDGFGNGIVFPLDTPSGYVHDLYAWTGSVGNDFDKDTTTYSMVRISPTAVADNFTFELDGSTTTPQEYKYGTTATWVIQVTDGTKDVAQADWEFTLATAEGDTSSPQNVTTATGIKLKTDANGQIVITKSFTDPDKDDDTDPPSDAFFVGTITAWETAGAPAVLSLLATWNDDTGVATTIKVSTASKYAVNKDGASNAVTATVTDQFGNGVSGVDVCFTSGNDSGGLAVGVGPTDSVRATNSSGQAVLGYTWDWDGAGAKATTTAKETFSAVMDIDGAVAGVCDDNDGSDTDNVFYWVNVAAAATNTLGSTYTPVLVDDVPNKAVVALDVASIYTWWQWDAGDQFTVAGTPDTMAKFETQIAKDSATPAVPQEVRVADYDSSGISRFWVRDV